MMDSLKDRQTVSHAYKLLTDLAQYNEMSLERKLISTYSGKRVHVFVLTIA